MKEDAPISISLSLAPSLDFLFSEASPSSVKARERKVFIFASAFQASNCYSDSWSLLSLEICETMRPVECRFIVMQINFHYVEPWHVCAARVSTLSSGARESSSGKVSSRWMARSPLIGECTRRMNEKCMRKGTSRGRGKANSTFFTFSINDMSLSGLLCKRFQPTSTDEGRNGSRKRMRDKNGHLFLWWISLFHCFFFLSFFSPKGITNLNRCVWGWLMMLLVAGGEANVRFL